jgi:hypothetical protein
VRSPCARRSARRAARIVAQLFAEAFVLSGLSALVGLGIVGVGLRMFDDWIANSGGAPFWIDSGISLGTVLYTLSLAVLGAVIVGVFPALRATGAQLREAIGSLGSGTKARLGPTWTALIVAQVAIAVAILPRRCSRAAQMVQHGLAQPGFAQASTCRRDSSSSATWRRAPTRSRLARPSTAHAAIVTELLERVATEPGSSA